MCLNRKRWQPGSVRFGPSAWKAEQLLLGPPDRGTEATWLRSELVNECVLIENVGSREACASVPRLGKPSNCRSSGPRDRSDVASIGTCYRMCLNRKRWQPGSVRFGPSAWKAEQLLLGPPDRGTEATWLRSELVNECVLIENVGSREACASVPRLGKPSNCCSVLRTEGPKRRGFDRNLLTNVS